LINAQLGLVYQGVWILERGSLRTFYRSPQIEFWFPIDTDSANSFQLEFPQFDPMKAQVAADDGEVYSLECRSRPKEARAVPLELKVVPLAGERLKAAGFDSSFILLHVTDISRVKEKDFMLKSFSQIIDTNNRSIRAQKNKIESLLNSMRQAVFAVDSQGLIGDPVSKFSKEVFGLNISGLTLFETLYSSLPVDGEVVTGVKSAFVAVFGEDELQWGLYSDVFPKRVEYGHPSGDSRLLKVESLPIWNEDTGLCERILFVVEDITEFERLEKEVIKEREKNQKNILMIQELAELDRGVIEAFLATSNRDLQRLQQGLESLFRGFERGAIGATIADSLKESVNELFRIGHTIKGNARTLKLTAIGGPAHETEQALEGLRGYLGSVVPGDLKDFENALAAAREGIKKVRLQFAAYSELARRVFGIEDEFRKGLLHETTFLLDQLERIFVREDSEDGLSQRLQELLGVSHRIKASLRALHSMKGDARSLGKTDVADRVHRIEDRLTSLMKSQNTFSLQDWTLIGAELREVALILRPLIMESAARSDRIQYGEAFVRLRSALDSTDFSEKGMKNVSAWHDLSALFAQEGLLGISSVLAVAEQWAAEEKDFSGIRGALQVSAGFYIHLFNGSFRPDAYLATRQQLLTAYDLGESVEALQGSAFQSDPLVAKQLDVLIRLTKLKLPMGSTLLQKDLLVLLDSVFYQNAENTHAGAESQERLPATIAVVERNFMSLSRSFEQLPEGREFDRILHELPVGSLRSRFDPMIYDIAKNLGKSVMVRWTGGQILVDRRKIALLQEALLHLLRNSLDHGLETKSARGLVGKAEAGVIEVAASEELLNAKRTLVLRVSDDGAGVPLDRVLAKARGLGLISERESKERSRNELLQLVFHPGLSTAEKVTQLSGRGVGMDVVLTGVRKLSGEVRISSEPGKGTTTELKIPLA